MIWYGIFLVEENHGINTLNKGLIMFGNDNEKNNGELYLYNFIESKCKIIFDVGIGGGTYYQLNPSISYHLFEAYKPYYDNFINKCGTLSNIKVNCTALGSEIVKIPFYFNYGMSFVKRADFVTTDLEIETNTLDNYIASNRINSIDFLKIDTEGWEFPILKGVENSLSKITHIQFEYGATWPEGHFKFQEAYDFLLRHGFETFIIIPNGITKVTDFSDHGRYCNYFSTRKIDDVKEIIR